MVIFPRIVFVVVIFWLPGGIVSIKRITKKKIKAKMSKKKDLAEEELAR